MKKIILMLSLLVSLYAYADCETNKIDINNKFDVAITALDIISDINKDSLLLQEASKSKSEVDMLYAIKRENIDFSCSLDKLNAIRTSDKENIKKGIADLDKYLQDKLRWNYEFQRNNDEFMSSHGDLNSYNNNLANLKIKKDDLSEQLTKAISALSYVMRFEQSDDTSIDMSKFGKYDYNFIWINNYQRNELIKKVIAITNFKKDGDTNMTILIGLAFWVDLQLSFKNKNIHTKEDIIKNYSYTNKNKT